MQRMVEGEEGCRGWWRVKRGAEDGGGCRGVQRMVVIRERPGGPNRHTYRAFAPPPPRAGGWKHNHLQGH